MQLTTTTATSGSADMPVQQRDISRAGGLFGQLHAIRMRNLDKVASLQKSVTSKMRELIQSKQSAEFLREMQEVTDGGANELERLKLEGENVAGQITEVTSALAMLEPQLQQAENIRMAADLISNPSLEDQIGPSSHDGVGNKAQKLMQTGKGTLAIGKIQMVQVARQVMVLYERLWGLEQAKNEDGYKHAQLVVKELTHMHKLATKEGRVAGKNLLQRMCRGPEEYYQTLRQFIADSLQEVSSGASVTEGERERAHKELLDEEDNTMMCTMNRQKPRPRKKNKKGKNKSNKKSCSRSASQGAGGGGGGGGGCSHTSSSLAAASSSPTTLSDRVGALYEDGNVNCKVKLAPNVQQWDRAGGKIEGEDPEEQKNQMVSHCGRGIHLLLSDPDIREKFVWDSLKGPLVWCRIDQKEGRPLLTGKIQFVTEQDESQDRELVVSRKFVQAQSGSFFDFLDEVERTETEAEAPGREEEVGRVNATVSNGNIEFVPEGHPIVAKITVLPLR